MNPEFSEQINARDSLNKSEAKLKQIMETEAHNFTNV